MRLRSFVPLVRIGVVWRTAGVESGTMGIEAVEPKEVLVVPGRLSLENDYRYIV